jgi:phosphoglucosamine mutase
VDGDAVLAMCSLDLLGRGALRNRILVGTVMSNWGLEDFCRRNGIRLVRAAVGDRFVVEAMLREDGVLGGEPSGHVVYRELLPTGDGLITALQVLRLMARSGKPLSRLASILNRCPQVLKGVRVSSKPPLEEIPEVRSAIRAAETALGSSGRLLVRYSGTENLCRVMVEGTDAALIDRLADSICEAVRRSIP